MQRPDGRFQVEQRLVVQLKHRVVWDRLERPTPWPVGGEGASFQASGEPWKPCEQRDGKESRLVSQKDLPVVHAESEQRKATE